MCPALYWNHDSTTANRKAVETVTNKIFSSADEILRGVMILEQKEDVPNKRVTVKLGMSRKTMATADSVKSALKQDSSQPPMATPPPSSGAPVDQKGTSPPMAQQKERRQSTLRDQGAGLLQNLLDVGNWSSSDGLIYCQALVLLLPEKP